MAPPAQSLEFDPADLLARVDELVRRLGRIDTLLENRRLRSKLLERVEVRLRQETSRFRQRISGLEADVRTGTPPESCWRELHDLQAESLPLFRESLRLLEGTFVREIGLDEGLCAIADRLLDTLSARCDVPWRRFTVLDEGEYFTGTAEIIRLRFPEVSIWSLPIAAHEFGHFVGVALNVPGPAGRKEFPFLARLEKHKEGEYLWWAVQEHFADVFATYVLGPAYACACLALRFNPVRAFAAGKRHPSANQRAHSIVRVLGRMDEDLGAARPYQAMLERIVHAWTSIVEQAGGHAAVAAEELGPLNDTIDDLYRLVDRHLKPARYSGWPRAVALTSALARGDDPLPRHPPLEIADVLNAAWIDRMRPGSDAARTADAVVRLCRSLPG